MRIRASWLAISVCGVAGLTRPAVAQVDQHRAEAFFKEAEALCERDGGRLWGVSLCAPMVIGDVRTQTFATSQRPREAPRPRGVGHLNAPIQWGGVTWIAYIWDDLANAPPWRRNEIMLHEMFHAVQPRLGLAVGNLENEQLDALDGRYWLQLEWRALTRALRTSGAQRNAAVRDALTFRQARRRIYPAAEHNERALEINEGVASYTGTVLAASSRAEATASALAILTGAERGESFVRTFAYVSGPAYGVLLDEASPGWHRALRSSDDLGLLRFFLGGIRDDDLAGLTDDLLRRLVAVFLPVVKGNLRLRVMGVVLDVSAERAEGAVSFACLLEEVADGRPSLDRDPHGTARGWACLCEYF
jgi:hypothetical protein